MWIDFISGNGGGGVTPSDVEQMIENKQNLYTASTLSDITSPKEGDVAVLISGNTETQYSYVNGEWIEPASKDYVNNVVGDIETALASI